MATETARPSGVPSTAEMLEMLDQVTQDIPRMLESLGNAIGTLVDRNTDPAKVDVWERNLKGFSGQYYGRLATCQNALRTVIRHLHTLKVDPHTIRPPTTALPPPAFSAPGPDKPYAPESSTSANQAEAPLIQGPSTEIASEAGLSLYAARLELKALQDMQKALKGLMEEDGEIEEETPGNQLSSPSDRKNGASPMETSPIITTTALSSVPVEAPTTTLEATAQLATRPIPPETNGTSKGAAAQGGGGLGGLAGYADSDGSDVEMAN